jgi:hypothetical protein
MKLTVYHATSSIFLRSIKERGLISIDIRRRFPDLSTAMKKMINRLDCSYSNSGTDWGEHIGFRGNCQRIGDVFRLCMRYRIEFPTMKL